VALIEAESHTIAAAERLDTGKPGEQAYGEVRAAADVIRFFAGVSRALPTPAAGEYVRGFYSHVRRRPIGPVGAILPWNYPVMMAAWRAGAPLAAGCPVLLKPAPLTPGSATILAALAAEALGPGVLAAVESSDLTGARLACHPGIAGVAFTGSDEVGQEVTRLAAGKVVSTECGGNSAAIVLDDAPPGTATALHAASVYNAGQSCAAPARVIVVGNDLAVAELAARTMASDASAFGPLISEAQHQRASTLIDGWDTIEGHAPEDGRHFPATLLIEPPNDHPAVTEEVFAPVLTVQRAHHLSAALALAGSVRQRLAASVWTRDITAARAVADALDVGEVWVNTHLTQTPELPHSGRGPSGTGTDLSVDAVTYWTRQQTVTEAR
jgi:acyl-CoA reductase-like NAD-dependent aldehyde dehydrogenase